MEYVTLGRTNLKVSVAGLGCGGHSRLGQTYGNSEAQSVEIVSAAIDQGINFIDTAALYRTEEFVGQAIKGRRGDIVLSTKIPVTREGSDPLGCDFHNAGEFKERVEKSLQRLNTDVIDILHLHGVAPNQYTACVDQLVPVLLDLQQEGKIRYLGITERFIVDPGHDMLGQALQDDHWDVIMAGFNMLNQSARDRVFKSTREKNIGTLIMFAVRRALSDKTALREVLDALIREGVVASDTVNPENPFDFLTEEGEAASVVEAAYRYCRHEPGADVILTGTGKTAHLEENIASLLKRPLSKHSLDRIFSIFGSVDTVSGN